MKRQYLLYILLAVFFYFDRILGLIVVVVLFGDLALLGKKNNIKVVFQKLLSYAIFAIILLLLNFTNLATPLGEWSRAAYANISFDNLHIIEIIRLVGEPNIGYLVWFFIGSFMFIITNLIRRSSKILKRLTILYIYWSLLSLVFLSEKEYYLLVFYPLFIVLFLENLVYIYLKIKIKLSLLMVNKKVILLKTLSRKKIKYLYWVLLFLIIGFYTMLSSTKFNDLMTFNINSSNFDSKCFNQFGVNIVKKSKQEKLKIIHLVAQCKVYNGLAFDQCLHGIGFSIVQKKEIKYFDFDELEAHDLNMLSFGVGTALAKQKKEAKLALPSNNLVKKFLDVGIRLECLSHVYLSKFVLQDKIFVKTNFHNLVSRANCDLIYTGHRSSYDLVKKLSLTNYIVEKGWFGGVIKTSTDVCKEVINQCISTR